MPSPTKELVPAASAAREFGVVRRTLSRWLKDDNLSFPKPEIIRTRWYFHRADLDNWKPRREKSATAEREPTQPIPSTSDAKQLPGTGKPLAARRGR